ncbi:protein FAR1-RELATED SEQUENCE 5-like [Carya illinoinensis]|uniref:protein FAR1-RELATED SEQUENCE 5-like n=1 Tax=Carya illinoinensis TaxID=32201 RepID=UPI001C71EFB9|nr:protein FAR1-RELATED SEQUENCE 5-like [Carya illinoinensis]
MNKSFRSLVVGVGGFENVPFFKKDCRNYIDKARHLRLGADGTGVLRDYFLRMQYKNLAFFALMDLNDDDRLKIVFWADPHSRAAYQYFGDVVIFDTIYLTNRYGMLFAPFVGVNHHGQSILLGAGLISSEDTKTFVWLFQTWKVPEKLGSYGFYKTGMKTALMKCVYDTQTQEEFEKCWDQFITTYNLHENVWLESLYTEHESPIEKRYQDLYTNEKFWEVQQQLARVINLDQVLLKVHGTVKTYVVKEEVCLEEFTKLVIHLVDFSQEDTGAAKCSCGLFEMKGIVCRHIFAVFKCNGIKSLPDGYILDR